MKAVDTFTLERYSRNDPKSPISQAILDLIKEKRRLKWLYDTTQDHEIFIIFQLWLTSHPRSTVVLLDTGTPATSREIYSEDADDGM